jgi:hypothetical protein
VALAVEGARVAEPQTKDGRAIRFATLLALPFTDKLTVLDRFLRRTGDDAVRVVREIGPLLVDAILADVAQEVHAALMRTSLDDNAEIETALPCFTRLTRFALPGVDEKSPQGGMMLSLCAGLRSLSRAQDAWWRLAGKRARLADFLAERSDTFTGIAFGGGALIEPGNIGSSPAAALLERFVEQHHNRISDMADRHHISRSAAAVTVFRHPEQRMGIDLKRDTDALLEPSSRIWSALELEHHRAIEMQRLHAQRELREMNREDREAMLVAVPVAQPVAQPQVAAIQAATGGRTTAQ